MGKLIGYMVGCDAVWLTSLEANGFDTIPVSNGYDGHGRNIQLFTPNDKVDLVLTYFHKLMPPLGFEMTTRDILHRTTTYDIPVLVVCPEELIDKAKSQAKEWPANVEFLDPSKVIERTMSILGAQASAGA